MIDSRLDISVDMGDIALREANQVETTYWLSWSWSLRCLLIQPFQHNLAMLRLVRKQIKLMGEFYKEMPILWSFSYNSFVKLKPSW